MQRDTLRIQWTLEAMQAAGLDLLLVTLPQHVLMLTGYWPIVGTAVALLERGGDVVLLAPEDERPFVAHTWADDVRFFSPGSLESLTTAAEAVEAELRGLNHRFHAVTRIGYAFGPVHQPATYVSMHLYVVASQTLLSGVFRGAAAVSADDLLMDLGSRCTPREIDQVRVACSIAANAFQHGARHIRPGITESQLSAIFSGFLEQLNGPDRRSGGHFWCMSGPNAGRAYGSFAHSTQRPLEPGDLVLVHCNSYVDGFFTDITRTYCVGKPRDEHRRMFEAIEQARHAAMGVIRPGISAATVDHAARASLTHAGFGPAFKHPTGHGVGFAAIDHNARPRLHPRSPDLLQPGAVFNVEPGIYFDDSCGMRHCDVLALSDTVEVLTPFHATLDELVR